MSMHLDPIAEPWPDLDEVSGGPGPGDNGALADAYAACLEAADAIARAVDQSTGSAQGTACPAAVAAAVREALYACRAASTTVRFALAGLGEQARSIPDRA